MDLQCSNTSSSASVECPTDATLILFSVITWLDSVPGLAFVVQKIPKLLNNVAIGYYLSNSPEYGDDCKDRSNMLSNLLF